MLQQIWERFIERFSPQAMADTVSEFLPNLVTAILTFVVYWLAWKLLKRVVKVGAQKLDLDPTQTQFAQTATKYVILTIGVVSALSDLGINTGSILASLGVAGLTLGFAARDTLSNLISGIFIFWDRPFVIGDLVEIGDKYGRVDAITLRTTRVVTVDGKMIAVPNSTVVNSMVVSYTNFPHIRIEVDFTIAVDQDLDRVREVFLQQVSDDEHWLDEPPPQMVITAINDYNIAVQFRVWLKDEKRHISTRFALREAMYKKLVEAGVEMPFETLNVHTRAAA